MERHGPLSRAATYSSYGGMLEGYPCAASPGRNWHGTMSSSHACDA